jgi:hypothetical protein
MNRKNLLNRLSDWNYLSESCIHPACRTSNTQYASIQNVVRKCKGSAKEPILVLYHAVGYALIVDCSKKTMSRNETQVDTRECLKKRRITFWRFLPHQYLKFGSRRTIAEFP